MNGDRITELHVRNLRTLKDVRLSLNGLTVLIGENGTGKSNIVEACELLRKVSNPNFTNDFESEHGGFGGLLRHHTDAMSLSIRLEGPEGTLNYSLVLEDDSFKHFTVIEQLAELRGPGPAQTLLLLEREDRKTTLRVDDSMVQGPDISMDSLAIHSFGATPPYRAVTRIIEALKQIEVHLPFQALPRWGAARPLTPISDSVLIGPAARLKSFSSSLPDAFHKLRHGASEYHWRETMDYVRLGLGEDVENIGTEVDDSGNYIALTLQRRGNRKNEPAFLLSEGELTYLAFVAIYRLQLPTSLLVFDGSELHLHPKLLARVLDFLEEIAKSTPVILATHSDHLLDGLKDPAAAAVLCELDENRATQLRRPDPKVLAAWLERYRGLGDLRSAGYEHAVFKRA